MKTLGAIAGSSMYREALGWEGVSPHRMAMCSFGSLTTTGAFVSEFMFTFALLFIAYGIAFEPRQGALFGPIAAPLFIGSMLGLILFASAGNSTLPGYAPGMNWAICVGPEVAMGASTPGFHVYFTGPLLASFLHALLFIGAPPHHAKDGCFTAPLLMQERVSRKESDARL